MNKTNLFFFLGYQCSIQWFYKDCKDLSLNRLVFEETLDEPQHYNSIICDCAHKTERIGYKHFAIKENDDNIACYAIDYNPSGSLTTLAKKAEVLRDLNQLLSPRKCPEKCDEVGCVRLGSGKHAAVYEVIPTWITLSPPTKTTVRTLILRSTTRKPFVRPPPPENWD